jgi:hypothetical protein
MRHPAVEGYGGWTICCQPVMSIINLNIVHIFSYKIKKFKTIRLPSGIQGLTGMPGKMPGKPARPTDTKPDHRIHQTFPGLFQEMVPETGGRSYHTTRDDGTRNQPTVTRTVNASTQYGYPENKPIIRYRKGSHQP